MSKHKKTRKEKIIADYRRQVYTLENKNSLEIPAKSHPMSNNSVSHAYVLKDITKTGLLTLSIIVLEVILFLLLKNRIITIPKINY